MPNRIYQTDQSLWEKIRTGDVNALRDLHERYFMPLCLFARKSVKQMPVSEELVSNCFLRLWESRKTIAIHHSVRAYLYFMVRNQSIDYLRSNKSAETVSERELPEIPSEEEMNQEEFYASLYHAIAKLPEQRRQILELAAFDSLSYRQIAERLNISINTVKTQMGRAYHALKEELGSKRMTFILSIFFKAGNSH